MYDVFAVSHQVCCVITTYCTFLLDSQVIIVTTISDAVTITVVVLHLHCCCVITENAVQMISLPAYVCRIGTVFTL